MKAKFKEFWKKPVTYGAVTKTTVAQIGIYAAVVGGVLLKGKLEQKKQDAEIEVPEVDKFDEEGS